MFHANEFFHGRPPFEDMGDQEKLIRVSKKLTAILRRHVVHGTVYALPVLEMADIAKDSPGFKAFDAKRDGVSMGVRNCLFHLTHQFFRLRKASGLDSETVALVFDRTDDREYELQNQYHYLCDNKQLFAPAFAKRRRSQGSFEGLYTSFSVADKDIETSLQCADFVAYEGYRFTSDNYSVFDGGRHTQMRKSFAEILKHPHIDLCSFSMAQLREKDATRRQVMRDLLADPIQTEQRRRQLKRASVAAGQAVAKGRRERRAAREKLKGN